MSNEKSKNKEHWYLPEEDERAKASQNKKEMDDESENGAGEKREWPYGQYHPHTEKSAGKKKLSGG